MCFGGLLTGRAGRHQTRGMEIHQLRCFLSVAREQHFGRAAASLHLTPSPVSRAVKALEAQLGTPLFERGYHTVRLTPAGHMLARGAEPLLEQLDDLQRRVAATAGGPDSPLVVGGSPFAPPGMFDLLVEQIRSAGHDRTVHVDVSGWEDTLDRIARNEVDIALLSLPFDHPAVDFRAIAALEMSVGLRSDDPLAGRDAVTWEDLREHRLTIPRRTQHASTLNRIRDQVDHVGHRLVDEATGPDVILLAAHVRGNRGRFFLALPPSMGGPWKVLDDPAFAVVPFRQDSPDFELCLAWNRRRYDTDTRLAALVDDVLRHRDVDRDRRLDGPAWL